MAGKIIPGYLKVETLKDGPVVHLRHLKCVGPEIARGDKRLLAQVRADDRDACKHGAAGQQ